MVFWQIFSVAGLIFLILEMLVPAMFFLNLALAAVATAAISLVVGGFVKLITIFVMLSILFIVLLRPFLLKTKPSESTGIEGKYIGKTAKVTETVTPNSGTISIYDERWEARSNEEIPEGSTVKITGNDNLIMFVEKV
ncbi:MAG: NfeD family protein [Heliobacteriaceae bacterium]|jgi:membrane protein implicated in regulation of membrane protease activity|nr:NfeD family protein [Heliobacteriaceae bacterium]